jgi:hypothetical protein
VIRDTLATALRSALSTLEISPIPESVHLERPARREHGDWSSNIALATAKAAGWNPRELAGRMAEIINADLPAHVTSVEIAGPGFVNFRLADSWLHDVLVDVETSGVENYARTTTGDGTKVLLEFVSANPTGPLHAGHGRGAAYGDSLARILERCGFNVDRENYLNDRGTQMQLFVASLIARRDGTPLPDATGPTLDATAVGLYILSITDFVGCPTTPSGIDLGVGGTAPRTPLVAQPNPFRDVLHVSGAPAGATLRLRDAAGRLIATGIGSSLSIPETPAGWYLLEVQAGNGRMARIPVVKE